MKKLISVILVMGVMILCVNATEHGHGNKWGHNPDSKPPKHETTHSVPDAGSSALLLGCSFGALTLIHRKLRL